jgi:hypothetical protein
MASAFIPTALPISPRKPSPRITKRLRELIDRCAPESKRGKIPILSGEWGNASNIKGVSLETECVTSESVA